MHLITNNESGIDIFEMTPKLEEIKKFRKIEMDNYPDDLKLRYLQTNTLEPIEKLFKNNTLFASELNFQNCNYEDFYTSTLYNCPINDHTKKILDDLLEKYYNNEFNKKHICTINYAKIIKYKFKTIEKEYLLMTQKNDNNFTQRVKEVKNILSLPGKLYTLELLLRSKFDLVNTDDIEKHLQLFDINYIKSYSSDEIKFLKEARIINNKVLDKSIKSSTKIYKKIKENNIL